jgi:hypothetical protein
MPSSERGKRGWPTFTFFVKVGTTDRIGKMRAKTNIPTQAASVPTFAKTAKVGQPRKTIIRTNRFSASMTATRNVIRTWNKLWLCQTVHRTPDTRSAQSRYDELQRHIRRSGGRVVIGRAHGPPQQSPHHFKLNLLCRGTPFLLREGQQAG